MFNKRENRRGGGNSRFPKSDYDHKVIDIRRVARVVAGGRRFTFRVTAVIGNRNGEVGVGMGKSGDTSEAIEKATRFAKKNLIKVNLTKEKSISSDITSKYASSKIYLRPSPEGHGLVAGSSIRTVLELAGVKNISAKMLSRTKNKLNNARATILALKKLG